MLIYSMACCSSFQDRLFLVTNKDGKAKEEKVSYHICLRAHKVVVRESHHLEVQHSECFTIRMHPQRSLKGNL